MIEILTLLVLTMTNVHEEPKEAVLKLEQEQMIRQVVATITPKLISPKRDFQSVLSVPEDLEKAYKENPTGVLNLLLRVADGANPLESVTAATYAMALLEPQSGGVVCIEHFNKLTYDVVDKAWETTPRYHWIGKIKKAMKQK